MRATLFLILALGGFVWILSSTHRETASTLQPIQLSTPAAAVVAISPATTTPFIAVGTLVFYPNNMGPIPYLLYEDESGHLASKALVFSALPPTDFSLWSGGRVSVEGVRENEHVVVSHIDYLGPP